MLSRMNIMGLDLSLTSTGYSINGETGTIAVKTRDAERLYDIREDVVNLVKSHDVDVVIVEGYAFSARNSQSHKIGELGGVIRLSLYELDVPYVEVPPTCRAKFATGKGNSSKTEVVSAVSARTGIVWSGKGTDDMCDAWLLEQMGLQWLGLSEYDWPKSSIDALKTVDWSPLDRGNSNEHAQ
jgi:crossover junction endodeoxyribonuclease RuvC